MHFQWVPMCTVCISQWAKNAKIEQIASIFSLLGTEPVAKFKRSSTHCNNILPPLKRPYLRTSTEKTWPDDAKVYQHGAVLSNCQYGVIKLNGRHLFSMETTWFWSLRLCYARSLCVVTILVGCKKKLRHVFTF